MKTNTRRSPCVLAFALIVLPCFAWAGPLPFRPVGESPTMGEEEQELRSIYTAAQSAVQQLPPGDQAAPRHSAMADELARELGAFVAEHTNSVWTPSVRLWLARKAQRRAGYSEAMVQAALAWSALRDSRDPRTFPTVLQGSGRLAKLLALTGRLSELDALEAQVRQQVGGGRFGGDWAEALELREWVRRHPVSAYRCGLLCLEQLGRLTQPGGFRSADVLRQPATTNGFSAADLVVIAGGAGLRVHAARLINLTNLPSPCIVHLRAEHFVVLREQRGGFFDLYDPADSNLRWVTAAQIAEEATGCVIVSDAAGAPDPSGYTTPLDGAAAGTFRGRMIGYGWGHDDAPCNECECPAGSAGENGANSLRPIIYRGHGTGGSGAAPAEDSGGGSTLPCSNCGRDERRIYKSSLDWFVSEPTLNLWLTTAPLPYERALGPDVALRLAFNSRHTVGAVSQDYWHGATFGNAEGGSARQWGCSWLSFAELSTDGYTVDLLLPRGGWATFTFASGASLSAMNFRHRLVLEKVSYAGTVTNLLVHHPDGAQTSYGVKDASDPSYAGVFYLSRQADSAGNASTFTYTPGYLLTNVTAADGTSFTLHYDEAALPSYITSASASYGATASFVYDSSWGGTDYGVLTNLTDAAGISSSVAYGDYGEVRQLVTPYGTTEFATGNSAGVFDRFARITRPDGLQEFYGQMEEYFGSDWPDFQTSQIPTNTPLGTLDTAGRTNRNSFYWNAQQFEAYTGISLDGFDWNAFKKSRIRHWLGSGGPNSLSLEQTPSPDGSTEGQLTWYDYAGKSANDECGAQVLPSVLAQVMPDGSTAYKYFERLTNGHPTKFVDKWALGPAAQYRTNTFLYAANNVDLLAVTNAPGVRVSSNQFNAYHQVVTNYDALGQTNVFQYDGTTHQLTNVIRPTDLSTIYAYDANRRLQQMTDQPINRTRSYTYYTNGNVETVTDERGLVVTNYWDGLNRLTGVKYPDGTTTSNRYTIATAYPNSSGGLTILDLTATKDRLDHWTYFGYDAVRRLTAETNANGVVTRYGYCTCGGVTSVTNAWNTSAQLVTRFDYDYQGNRLYTYHPDATVTNTYDALGRLTGTCNAWGCRSFGYDNLNRLTGSTNAFGTEQITVFDIADRPIYVTDANNVTITNTYDDLGRLRTRTAPDGGVEAFGYSARGLVAYTNQLSATNFYVYDEAGRKTYETNANWELIRYTNSAAGDLLSLTDGKTQTTRWNYDEYGRVTNKLDQAGVEILRYKYDQDGRLTNRWSIAKTNTYYRYDAVGNLTNIDYAVSPDISFQYDALNRVTSMVDAAGTNLYSYAAGGQLWTEDGPWASDTVTNTYNNRLRTALGLAQPSGKWTNAFNYDGAKRLTNVTSMAGAFDYYLGAAATASPLAKKIALPNTSYITNTYDNVARLTGTWLKDSSHAVLDSATYGYNAGHQRTTFTNAAETYLQYTYDPIGQLKVADSSAASEDRGYQYDAAWNLNYRTNNGVLNTFKVDTKNQLTNATPVGTQTYDPNGNVTYSDGPNNGYDYDDENRLVNWYYYDGGYNGNGSPTSYGDFRTEFVYDGRGRLRKRVEYAGGSSWGVLSETRYIYDGMRVIQERSSANTPLVSYTRGTDLSAPLQGGAGGGLEGAGGIGGLLGRSHGYASTNGNWYTHNFYHADGNGNITYLVTSSQGLAASYRYDPFGNTTASSGSLAAANVYRFSSKEIHVNSGLYYYGYRWYAANLQRWLNRDPIMEDGGINLFGFVKNDPVNFVDPEGFGSIATLPGQCALVLAVGEEEAALVIGQAVAREAAKRIAAKAAAAAALALAAEELRINAEHKKNPTPSNRPKHEKGRAREKIDQGGEKGDAVRDPKPGRPDPAPEPAPKPGKPKFPNVDRVPRR